MTARRLLLVVGSPRKKGTSFSFCRTIKALAEESGHEASICFAIDYFDGRSALEDLAQAIARSDAVGIVTPLYVDTLPYPMLWVMERLSGSHAGEFRGKSLFAIGQSGFPDATLLSSLLDSCRFFAESLGMHWLGGLGYGGGAIIDGTPLESLGAKGRRITAALRLATSDILQGKPVPREAQRLIAEKIPRLLYYPLALFLNHRARRQARKLGTDLASRAYLE